MEVAWRVSRFGAIILRRSKRNPWITGTIHQSYFSSNSMLGQMKYEGAVYPKFREDEMAVLTNNPVTVPMLKTIMKCPVDPEEWHEISREDKKILLDVSRMYESTKIPSVTKVLQSTQSPLNQIILARWKRKMTEQLGKEGFAEYMRKITGEGTSFHNSVENYLKETPIDVVPAGPWKSIHQVLEKVNDVYGTEFITTHPLLSYLGKTDCVALYENKLCVFDWKLSSKKKETLKKCFDDPYQVAAYAGAFNASCADTKKISNAVIVKAYRDGSPADVHFMNEFVLGFYWEGWIRRLARYHVQVFNAQQVDRRVKVSDL